MTTSSELGLGRDEFAFRFDTEAGIEADDLAVFLQRAATVARRAGADLKVVGVPSGSLIVKLRAVAKAANKEFKKTPLAGTASAFAIGGVIYAIANAMVPSHTNTSPLAKAGVQIIEQHQVKKIEIVTVNQTIVIMDEDRAAQIRMLDQHRKQRKSTQAQPEYRLRHDDAELPRFVEAARQGLLTGQVFDVEGELHFRPDGFRFLVPIDAELDDGAALHVGRHIRIAGAVLTRNGQPDRLVVTSIID